jgi:Ca-activated chloride channel family protein
VSGFRIATVLDAPRLRGLAARSGGAYFAARDAAALRKVYDSIDLHPKVAGRRTEVTAIVAGVGWLCFLGAAGLWMCGFERMI